MEIYYKIRGDKILNNRNQIKVVGMHRVSGYESCIPDRYPAGHPVGPDTGFQSRNPTILKLEFEIEISPFREIFHLREVETFRFGYVLESRQIFRE